MIEKRNPAGARQRRRGIVKTYPCVSNSQTTAREALKQDAQLDPKVIQELSPSEICRGRSKTEAFSLRCGGGVPTSLLRVSGRTACRTSTI